MTIKEAGKMVVGQSTKPVSYCIGFNGNDETELDACSLTELEKLWKSLCSEFGCSEDSVDYIERAQARW